MVKSVNSLNTELFVTTAGLRQLNLVSVLLKMTVRSLRKGPQTI